MACMSRVDVGTTTKASGRTSKRIDSDGSTHLLKLEAECRILRNLGAVACGKLPQGGAECGQLRLQLDDGSSQAGWRGRRALGRRHDHVSQRGGKGWGHRRSWHLFELLRGEAVAQVAELSLPEKPDAVRA